MMPQWNSLVLPCLCVIGVTLVYGLLVRWLLRGRLNGLLAGAAFAGSAGVIVLGIAACFFTSFEQAVAPGLLANLQAATSFGKMFKLALIYAALPEEAVKIGIVLLLLLLLRRRVRHGSDPAEMLLYSALGFAMCESLLYVVGFATMPQFRDHLVIFAVARGIFGGFLHALLGMVAGFLLARRWGSSQRWLWVLIAYGSAVLLHASFDGSLLHLVFQGLIGQSSGTPPVDTGASVVIFAGSAIVLLILAFLSLWRSRRLAT
jgi:RsiW-degrading membrane proteinase PrsW (M82 family)